MSSALDLGKLVDLSPGLGVQPSIVFDAVMAVAAENPPLTNKEVAEKAVSDTKEVPSIWFVNFPEKPAAAQKELLAKYMQNIEDYRCWASLRWWRTVFSERTIAQDGSKEAIATRSAFCAKVATNHMKRTPWLSLQSDRNISKNIECRITEFHTDLINAVLLGFVGITPAVIAALEAILISLRRTIQQSTSNSENRTIVCERYQYVPEADVIRSYIRIVSFSVTEKMKNVENAKKTESWVKCTIDYNDYEADFNQKKWKEASDKIDEEQKKALDDFLKEQTIDCQP